MTNEGRHILESGDLELFALDALDASRRNEIEGVLRRDPDLQNELSQLRADFESYAVLHSVKPASASRDTIIAAALSADSIAKSNAAPAAKPVVLRTTTHQSAYRYAIAASFAFFISTSAAVYYFISYHELDARLSQTELELASLRTTQQVMTARLSSQDKHLALLRDPNILSLSLDRQAAAPVGTQSLVLWNRTSHEVFIDASAMPDVDANKDYQLWALVGGAPVDLGVFDKATGMSLQQMKSIAAADAFAVTLEPKGGSKNPTLTQLMVLGKIPT